MPVDGDWKITINSPLGAHEIELLFKANGTTFTGTQSARGQTADITDGRVDGDRLSWSGAVTQPFPMTLTFDGTVSGDRLLGSVQAGSFGTFPFSGQRVG